MPITYFCGWWRRLFFPVFWIFLAAFKSGGQIVSREPVFLFQPTLDNITRVLLDPNFLEYLKMSFILSIGSVLIAWWCPSWRRIHSPATGRQAPISSCSSCSPPMVPAPAVVLPIFLMYTALGWSKTFHGMIFYAMFSIPFSLWILKGFLDGVSLVMTRPPSSTAARLHTMFRVVLPQVKPGLVAAFIFNILFVWNEFLFNYILGGKGTTMILVIGHRRDKEGAIDWSFIAAISFIYVLPPILVIFLFQKYLLVGMTFGTVRGEV